MGQRVDLDPAGAVFDLEEIERGTGAGLKALAPGDPAVKAAKGALQRDRLAQGAAGVGVAQAQGAIWVVAVDVFLIGADHRTFVRPRRSATSA